MSISLNFGGELAISSENKSIIQYDTTDNSILTIVDVICRFDKDVVVITANEQLSDVITEYSSRGRNLSSESVTVVTPTEYDSQSAKIVVSFDPSISVKSEYVIYAVSSYESVDRDTTDTIVEINGIEPQLNETYGSKIIHKKSLYGQIQKTRKVEYQQTIYVDTTRRE